MNMEFKKWSQLDQNRLMAVCNAVDRTYLANRLPFPYTEEDAAWWLRMAAERDGVNGIYRSITVDGQIVGTISVEQKTDVFCKDAEIGYFLLTDYWARGMMTEAVSCICDIAFRELDIIRITGLVDGPNVVSQKVLEKNGFTCEGVMKNAVVKNDHIWDLYIYGKLK